MPWDQNAQREILKHHHDTKRKLPGLFSLWLSDFIKFHVNSSPRFEYSHGQLSPKLMVNRFDYSSLSKPVYCRVKTWETNTETLLRHGRNDGAARTQLGLAGHGGTRGVDSRGAEDGL